MQQQNSRWGYARQPPMLKIPLTKQRFFLHNFSRVAMGESASQTTLTGKEYHTMQRGGPQLLDVHDKVPLCLYGGGQRSAAALHCVGAVVIPL